MPTPRKAACWIPTTIRLVLENPVHKGRPVFGRQESRSDETRIAKGKGVRFIRNTDPFTWVSLQAPALVSEELWEQCQHTLQDGRARRAGNPARMHLLSGLLRCPTCQRTLSGYWKHYSLKDGSEATEHYCQCRISRPSQSSARSVCGRRLYVAHITEQLVQEAIQAVAARPELVRQAIRASQENTAAQDSTDEVSELDRSIREIKAKENATIKAQIEGIMAGTSPGLYNAVLRELAEQKEKFQVRRAKLRRPAQKRVDPVSTAATLQQAAADVHEALTAEELTIAEKRAVISSIVDCIPIR